MMPISAAAPVVGLDFFVFGLGVISDSGASVYYNWVGNDLAVLLAQPRSGSFAVMAEKRQPAFADDERQPFFLVLERGQRIGVEAHDPRQRQMRRHGHEIGKKKGRLAGGREA